MTRRYNRDSRGRFASGGGGGSRRPAPRGISRGTNRLTRDNSGRITSVGGDGATARGGRLRTASGKQRATVTARGVKRASPSGAIRKSDVVTARTQNSISRNIEKRNKSGLNPPTAARENQASRVARAERRIAGQKRATAKPAAAAKPARVKATGRRAPLTGVNAVVARNPAGFKGLPVSLRSRSEAAAAQRQRNERLVRATRNLRSGYTVEFSRGGVGKVVVGSMRIRKGRSEQGNLLTGKTETVVSGRRITMSGRSALGRRATAKPAAAAKPARVKAKPAAAAKPQASSARQRGDTASVNVPMRGSRGRRLGAEISRNVKQQKVSARAADRQRNRQFKSDQSRAKALRTAHVGAIAKAKGLSKGQVESALKAQSPSVQIKALKNWVRDNRKGARKAAKRRR